jgi:S1-C subfamily serine protease
MMRKNDSESVPGRPRRRLRLLICLLLVAAAGLGAVAVTLAQHDDPAAASARLDQARVEREVAPGLVDIKASLQYPNESADDTGIVVSADGLVLTSNDDIAGSTSVRATLAGSGRTYTARVLGYDVAQDIALLQLDGAAHLPAVALGNSSQVTVGLPVLAIGNAQGDGGLTPAAGVIDALDRTINSGGPLQGLSIEKLGHMEQTSAQIGLGDDGGALADSAGQVVGMITTASTSSGQQSTTGFAIPINTAMAIVREISNGQASSAVYLGEPGFLGVEVQTSTSGSRSGVLIAGVLGGTPASRAGLAAGDVITGIDGLPVTTPASLSTLLQRWHPGAVVSVSWAVIDGAARTAHVTLGSGPYQ